MARSFGDPTRPESRPPRSTRLVLALMLASVLTLLFGIVASTPASARADQGGAGGRGNDREHKVTLCHATHSFTNPYVMITVDFHAVIHAGHGGHEGPIFTPTIDPHTKWGDIIPPFDFGGDAVYAGMNWTAEGQAILAAGCKVAEPPTTTTPTTVGPTTTEAPTTTAAPTTTEAPSTTTTEEATTTTAAPETTTTSTPEETTTTATVQVQGVTVSRGPTTTVAATTATPPVKVLGAEVERTPAQTSGNLPLTGSETGLLIVAALALIGAGTAMVLFRRHAAAA